MTQIFKKKKNPNIGGLVKIAGTNSNIIKAKSGTSVSVWAPNKCKSGPKLKEQCVGRGIRSPAAVTETCLHVWTGNSSDYSRCPTVACPSEFE